MKTNACIAILCTALMTIGCTTTPQTQQERQNISRALQNVGATFMQYGEIQDREYRNRLLQQQNALIFRGQQQRFQQQQLRNKPWAGF